MGRRGKLHRQQVISGRTPPYRASPDKPRRSDIEEIISTSDRISQRIQKLKEQEGE